jgi:hypothetical protein
MASALLNLAEAIQNDAIPLIPYFVTRVQKLAGEEKVSSRILRDVAAKYKCNHS